MLRTLAICLVVGVLISTLITPPIYLLLDYLIEGMRWPYSRVFDRVIMAVIFLILFLYRKKLNLSGTIQLLRGSSIKSILRVLLFGVLVSAITGAASIPFEFGDGFIIWRHTTLPTIIYRVFSMLPLGLAIGVLEEVFFRGILFQALRHRLGLIAGMIVSSLIYSFVHFIRPDKAFVMDSYSPMVGFEYLVDVLSRFNTEGVLLGVFGLFLAGMVLAYILVRFSSLWLCIGVHAGWIIVMKVAVKTNHFVEGVELPAGMEPRYFLVGQWEMWVAVLCVPLILELLNYFCRGGIVRAERA